MRHRSSTLWTLWRRSTRKRLALLAVVAVLARALIPTGFMPAVVDSHPQMIICDGGMSSSAHHTHHGPAGSGADSPCPFAMSAAAAPLPAVPGVTPAFAAVGHSAALAELPAPAETPYRHTAPRGPPPLASRPAI